MLWAVNIGSLELHTSLHTRGRPAPADRRSPSTSTRASGVDVLGVRRGRAAACAGARGDRAARRFAKTSGSKGLQVYVPLNTDVTYAETKPLARAVAEVLEARVARARRLAHEAARCAPARCSIDWSQNTEHKSMVCVYSRPRARRARRSRRRCAWDEVERGRARDGGAGVRARRRARGGSTAHGDLFADVLSLEQRLA